VQFPRLRRRGRIIAFLYGTLYSNVEGFLLLVIKKKLIKDISNREVNPEASGVLQLCGSVCAATVRPEVSGLGSWPFFSEPQSEKIGVLFLVQNSKFLVRCSLFKIYKD